MQPTNVSDTHDKTNQVMQTNILPKQKPSMAVSNEEKAKLLGKVPSTTGFSIYA